MKTAKTAQLEATVQAATAGDVLPIASVNHDRHNCMVFHVDRQKAYSNIIQRVLYEGEGYGCRAAREEESRVIVNPVDIQTYDSDDELRRPPSLVQLRAIALLKHVLCLLNANGYQAQTARLLSTGDMQDLLSVLKVEAGACQERVMEKLCRGLVQRAQSSPYRETLQSAGTGQKAAGSEGVRDSVVMNLRTFVASSGLLVGRAGYDKNLNLVDVRLEDGTVSDTVKKAAVMESITSENQEAEGRGGVPVCLHLVSQSLAYTQQQADLLWQMCTERAASCVVQRHLVFGTISGRKSCASAAMDAKEFYNVRHRQMTQAAMMKYGDHDQGPAWEDMIHSLTLASITFDLLSTASSSQVHVDLSEEEGDNRSGPFIMYNCARLASLLLAFEQQVEQGRYPPLPDVGHVNFQLLREEEEWTMALLYIHGFPRLVQDTLQHWNLQEGIAANIDTHKICHFLLNFSKTLSSYYSRYHILGLSCIVTTAMKIYVQQHVKGSEAHLLPLMFARLSLMKAAHQVLCNGLRLLGLQPLAQL